MDEAQKTEKSLIQKIKCEKHPQQKLRYVCLQSKCEHNRLLCDHCIISHSQNHPLEAIIKLKEIVKSNEIFDIYNWPYDPSKSIMNHITNLINQFNSQRQQGKPQIIKDVEIFFDDLDLKISEKLKELKKETVTKIAQRLQDATDLKNETLEAILKVYDMSDLKQNLETFSQNLLGEINRIETTPGFQVGDDQHDVEIKQVYSKSFEALDKEINTYLENIQKKKEEVQLNKIVMNVPKINTIDKFNDKKQDILKQIDQLHERINVQLISNIEIPQGIQVDYNIENIKPLLRPIFDEEYKHCTLNRHLVEAYEASSSEYVLVGAYDKDHPNVLLLGAFGLREVVLQREYYATRDNAIENNGVWWYKVENKSFGFSPIENVSLNSADTHDDQQEKRLSWHLCDSTGYRIGRRTSNYEQYRKVIFEFI